MNEILFVNTVFSFVLLLIGLMFLSGIWREKGRFWGGLNLDRFFFPVLKDRKILKKADQLAFMICIIMAVFTLLNGIISTIYPALPNVSAIFIFIAVFLSWPIRILFVVTNKNKKYQDVPAIWPFKH